jgi:hypothetical protein
LEYLFDNPLFVVKLQLYKTLLEEIANSASIVKKLQDQIAQGNGATIKQLMGEVNPEQRAAITHRTSNLKGEVRCTLNHIL